MHIFPISYLPPVSWFAAAMKHGKIVLEVHQHFRKQQYTSRAQIKTSNRIMPLTIPIQRRGQKAPIKDKKISYAEKWQKQHWQSLVSAYQGTPFFEYYQDKFEKILHHNYTWLVDLNMATTQTCLEILGLEVEMGLSDEYHDREFYQSDYRKDFDPSLRELPPWFHPIPYWQVFDGFTPGLSIVDLIFNMGPEGRLILRKSFTDQSNKG